MSEYPKPLFLEGWGFKGSLVGVADSWYRVDSPEDEQRIREEHAKKIELAQKETAELFHAR